MMTIFLLDVGRCNCGVCECNSGWSGEACDCTLDETPCFDKSTDALNPAVPCNGNGQCTCGICACGEAEEGGMVCFYSQILGYQYTIF